MFTTVPLFRVFWKIRMTAIGGVELQNENVTQWKTNESEGFLEFSQDSFHYLLFFNLQSLILLIN